jgi:2-polyprenyl-3-methyl-5-hydroxy-6-metoxy-1,4-benzoquinol methylase
MQDSYFKIIRTAERKLLDFYENRQNEWFVSQFWPENRERIIYCLHDSLQHQPPPGQVLDIGAHNGFATKLFAELGYTATACDGVDIEDRSELMSSLGDRFIQYNLNAPNPLIELDSEHYDIVFMGEIFEHILNTPARLLRNVARSLKPSGLLILTTPNPATIANAIRLLLGDSHFRGSHRFAHTAKIENCEITSDPSIHYREYTTSELSSLIHSTGLLIEEIKYFSVGSSTDQDLVRKTLKNWASGIFHNRLLGRTQYIRARKPDVPTGRR